MHVRIARWPGRCLACDLPTPPERGDLCAVCHADLPWCEAPSETVEGAVVTLAPLYFQDGVRDWVHRLKYHGGLVEGQVLGQVLGQAVRAHYLPLAAELALPPPWRALPTAILPVPMPARSWLRRGRNPATVLARPCARALGLPVLETLVRCAPKAASQHQRSRAERQLAMTDAFSLHGLAPKRIAIVDDVLTTGATCRALCRLLRQAGCTEVHVWCATHTPAPTC